MKDKNKIRFFKVDPHNDPIWAQNVFSQTGERWKKNRNAWTMGMTTSKIKGMYKNIDSKCSLMIDYLKRHVRNDENEPLEARLVLFYVLYEIYEINILFIYLIMIIDI